jgi:hypothetical protein
LRKNGTFFSCKTKEPCRLAGLSSLCIDSGFQQGPLHRSVLAASRSCCDF